MGECKGNVGIFLKNLSCASLAEMGHFGELCNCINHLLLNHSIEDFLTLICFVENFGLTPKYNHLNPSLGSSSCSSERGI